MDPHEVLDRYFEAIRTHDWSALADCLASDVHRTGPYLDVVEGREEYVAYLARVVPSLEGYRLTVSRIDRLGGGEALVRLSETVEVNGVSSEFPEALLFDFDSQGLIARVDIYIKQPPSGSG